MGERTTGCDLGCRKKRVAHRLRPKRRFDLSSLFAEMEGGIFVTKRADAVSVPALYFVVLFASI